MSTPSKSPKNGSLGQTATALTSMANISQVVRVTPVPNSLPGSTVKPVSNSSPGTTLPVMSKSPPENYGKHVKPEKIIFGKKGSGPGEFDVTRDAVVSADNEIFVVDGGHRRVQVFSLNGTFLRFFPTTVPGEDGREMFPTDVDIDKEGHLWVTGTKKIWSDGGGDVVKYRKDGKPLSKFHIDSSENTYPRIAVDAHGNKIYVTSKTEGKPELLMFHPDGILSKRFGNDDLVVMSTDGSFLSIDVDNYGNVYATKQGYIHVYSPSGRLLFRFGQTENNDGVIKFGFPRDICTDISGHIIVAEGGISHGVHMFTNLGNFVRTVVKMSNPYGLALGPDGQLVVTSMFHNTVTIFPSELEFP
ncbi:E3 ubiquitin-protein ligase TRIM32-like [Branchiostoma floridae x Branchiostoma japonicum]